MDAFSQGFEMGRNWVGPNGDGSMGALSHGFVRERAEMHAAGFRFDELTYVPEEEQAAADEFMRGFHAGREQRAAA